MDERWECVSVPPAMGCGTGERVSHFGEGPRNTSRRPTLAEGTSPLVAVAEGWRGLRGSCDVLVSERTQRGRLSGGFCTPGSRR